MSGTSSVLLNGTKLGDKIDVIVGLGSYTYLWPGFCESEVAEIQEIKILKYEETKEKKRKSR